MAELTFMIPGTEALELQPMPESSRKNCSRMFGKEICPSFGIQLNKIFVKVHYFFCASNLYSRHCGASERESVPVCAYLLTPAPRRLETTAEYTPCKPHSAPALLTTTFDIVSEMVKKVIVVTGANKGIGLAIVETLLQQLPEAVVLLGSRDASRGWSAFFIFHRRFLSKMERLLPNAHSLH